MLVALSEAGRIDAEDAVRSADYTCPACKKIVHVRRRRGWITHFYHLVLKGCAWESEGTQHRAAKRLIGEEYRRRGFDVAYEWTLEDERKKNFPRAVIDELPMRRTDVMIWRQGGKSVRSYAIEIQDSHIAEQEFRQRMRDWEVFGVAILWLIVAPPKLNEVLANTTAEQGPIRFSRYSIRPFERLIWNRTRKLWFVVPARDLLYCARVSQHKLFKEKYVNFDHTVGDFAEAGGYEYESQRYVDLEIAPPTHISAIRIDATERFATWQ
jgi:competence CoiA-like predicted nuclease